MPGLYKITSIAPLAFERSSHKIAIAPDQPTPAHHAEIIERNAKFGRHDVQAIQSKAGAMVGDVADTTRVDALLTGEVHRYIAIDRRAANGAALDIASGLQYFLKSRHAAAPSHEETKPPSGV
jgi:hypothetical protein